MADALSRRSIILTMMSSQVIRFEEPKNQYMADPYLNQIVKELQRSKAVKKLPYRLHDGYLFKGNQLCILEGSFGEQIIRKLCGKGLGGHFGRDETMALVTVHYSWPYMYNDA